jgi:hypothetical protein
MVWCVLGVVAAVVVQAQVLPRFGEERLGISTAAGLKLLTSARSAALVNATTAVADAAHVWLNPALAAELNAPYAVGFLSQRLVADIWYHAATVGWRLGTAGTVVFSGAGLVVPPVEETTEFRPYGTGRQFQMGHWNIGVAYGHRFTEQFAAGIALRYVHERWAEAAVHGVVWDAGTLYWTGIGSIRFAVAVSHFGLPMQATGDVLRSVSGAGVTERNFREFAPPTVFHIGVAGEVLHDEFQRWTVMFSLEHPSDGAESYAVASEYARRFSAAFPAEVMLRAGLRARVAEWWAGGVGLRIPVVPFLVQLDYALSARAPLGVIHRVGVALQPWQRP